MSAQLHTDIGFQDRDITYDLNCSEKPLLQFIGMNYIYEPEVISPILNFVKPGDICIDAGANLGYHSLLMSKVVGEDGEVLAFEPDPKCLGKLQANLEINAASNVTLLPVALWCEACDFVFHSSEMCGYSSFLSYLNLSSTAIQVRTMTLDDAVDLDRHIRLIKIDCEGAEEYILRGAEKLLTRGVDAIIVEFNFSIMSAFDSSEASIRKYMLDLGYDFFFLKIDGSPPEYIPPEVSFLMGNGDDGKAFHFNGMFSKRNLIPEWKPWKIAKLNDLGERSLSSLMQASV